MKGYKIYRSKISGKIIVGTEDDFGNVSGFVISSPGQIGRFSHFWILDNFVKVKSGFSITVKEGMFVYKNKLFVPRSRMSFNLKNGGRYNISEREIKEVKSSPDFKHDQTLIFKNK